MVRFIIMRLSGLWAKGVNAVNDKPHCHVADNPGALAQDLARHVVGWLQAALHEHEQALLVVSGGSTPVPFFEAMARQPLNWARVTITLADERWVDPTHPDSNEALVRARLLQGPVAQARFVPMYNGAATPQEGLDRLNETMASLPWPAAVMVLGMGGDGHTASLFPAAQGPAVWQQTSGAGRCMAVAAPSLPNVPRPRVSLTPQALLDARVLVLHVTGDSKVALLEQALQPGPAAELPVRVALHQDRVPCHVFQTPSPTAA